jgi:hypothetical protein
MGGFILMSKAQFWGIDLMVAMIIFSVAIAVFYIYSLNQPSETEQNFENLFYDGGVIADALLSQGYPEDWNSGDVVTLGILSSGKINETKLERFYDLASSDYERTRQIFNTGYNYWFFLSEEMDGIDGIGLNQTNPRNLVKVTRFSIYKNKPVTVYLYIWE